MGKIIAIGGEEIGPLLKNGRVKPIVCDKIHREILAITGKKNPKVLFIPTAHHDSEEFIAGFEQYYKGLGAGKVTALRLIREKPSGAEIKAKILSADAIYINGGNTFRMMRIWRRYGVDKLLKQAYRQGIVMSGHSAGAICWFTYGCSDSFYKKQPFRVAALGIIDTLLCPHYDTEPVRQPALKKMLKRTPRLAAIALDEYAAIEIIDDKYRILPAKSEAKARRAFWKDGEYMTEEIVANEEFEELKPLLT